MRKHRKLMAAALSAAIACGAAAACLLPSFQAGAEASAVGLGDTLFTWDREIYTNTTLTHTMSQNNNGEQKTYTVTFNPKTSGVKPVIAYGGNAMYGSTMSSLVSQEEEIGQHVVFGINGDAYDTSNGIALGLTIDDGKLITSSSSAYAFGFTQEGEVVYGDAALDMSVTIGDESYPLTQVNKERKMDKSGLYLLTPDFNDVTASSQAGAEVVFRVSDGDGSVRIGEQMTATLERSISWKRTATATRRRLRRARSSFRRTPIPPITKFSPPWKTGRRLRWTSKTGRATKWIGAPSPPPWASSTFCSTTAPSPRAFSKRRTCIPARRSASKRTAKWSSYRRTAGRWAGPTV